MSIMPFIKPKEIKLKLRMFPTSLKAKLSAEVYILDEESKSFDIQEVNELLIDLNKRTNVVLTPHVAGWTKESYFKLSDVLADKILK